MAKNLPSFIFFQISATPRGGVTVDNPGKNNKSGCRKVLNE